MEIPETVLPCFFQVLTEGLEENTAVSNIHVEFINNTAGTAGSSLYGGYLNDCQGLGLPVRGYETFKKIFHYKSSHSDLSVISSDPVGVCFCFGTDSLMPYCCIDSNCKKSISMYNVKVYPGETFFIPAVLVGQINGTVPGVVRSFFDPQSAASLGNLQRSQTINTTNCTTLKYTVFSIRKSETTFDLVGTRKKKLTGMHMRSQIYSQGG